MHKVDDRTAGPLVSFVIPARNEERFIGACLDAIARLHGDRSSWECVVIDNGSLDGTAEIARSKGARVFTVPDVTVSALRNVGARESGGQFLGFVDADCVVDEDWMPNATARFCDPSIACVGCFPDIPKENTWVQKAWSMQNQRQELAEDVDWLPSMNILVRKSAFNEVGGFNESLTTCEDVDFCYRLKKKGFKIVSDRSVKSIHYGEARTIREFFKKERWRGQSNWQGLLSHGLYWSEIPSLFLPFYFVLVLAFLSWATISLFQGDDLPIVIALGATLLPPCLMALRTSFKAGDFGSFARLSILYLVYSLARAAAMVSVTKPRWAKAVSS